MRYRGGGITIVAKVASRVLLFVEKIVDSFIQINVLATDILRFRAELQLIRVETWTGHFFKTLLITNADEDKTDIFLSWVEYVHSHY